VLKKIRSLKILKRKFTAMNAIKLMKLIFSKKKNK
jgi:hypothetical protein